jgi:hypothetical protein
VSFLLDPKRSTDSQESDPLEGKTNLSSQTVTPALEYCETPSLYPRSPPDRAKRRRYSEPSSDLPTSGSTRSDYAQYPSHVAYSPMLRQQHHQQQQQQPEHIQSSHHPHRLRSSTHAASPSRRSTHDVRYGDDVRSPGRPGVASGRLGDSQHQARINEFDLFHGELLESDPEDSEDPLPPGSHRDLF